MLPLLYCLVICVVGVVDSANIGVIMPGAFRYQRRGAERIAQYLALKNHGVQTFRANFFPETRHLVMPKLHMVEELKLSDLVPRQMGEDLKQIGSTVIWQHGDYDSQHYEFPFLNVYVNACQAMLNSDLRARMKRAQLDVIIVYSDNPCYLALVHSTAIPFIYIDQTGFSEDTAIASGTPLYPQLLPYTKSKLGFGPTWSLFERIHNVFSIAREYLRFSNIAVLQNLHPKYSRADGPVTQMFRNDVEIKKLFPNFPDVNDIKRQAALYMVNSDPLLEHPHRSVPPHVIYVGSAQSEDARPLMPPWNNTIALGKKGTILISFGEFVNSSALPRQMQDAILGAIRRLPDFRFYWRIGSPTLPALDGKEQPSNLNLTQFIPQVDILGDKRTRLLVTNGGMSSIMEAVRSGVPMLGIPVCGPNYNNMRKVEQRKMGRILDRTAVTEETVYKAIKEMTENRIYEEKTRVIAKAMRDRPLDAFETMIYWIEHVAQNKGGLSPITQQPFNLLELSCDALIVLLVVSSVCIYVGLIFSLKLVNSLVRSPITPPINPQHTNGNGKKTSAKKTVDKKSQ